MQFTAQVRRRSFYTDY